MGEFDFEKYVAEEFKTIWAAIDAQRKITGGLSEKVAVIDYKLDNVQDGVNSIKSSVENLNKATVELDKVPLKEKAKLFDTTIGVIIKNVVPWVIAAIAILYNKVKGG